MPGAAQPQIRSDGAVAQLGERLVRNEEVSGSIPLSSTRLRPDQVRGSARRAGLPVARFTSESGTDRSSSSIFERPEKSVRQPRVAAPFLGGKEPGSMFGNRTARSAFIFCLRLR